MKNLYIAFALFISGTAFGQIEQDVNKTSGTESNAINDIDSIRFNAGQTEMQIILNNGTVVNHAILDINNVTFSGQLVGEVTSLDCAAANITGTLVEGVAASGVSAEISYTGGNGGSHNGQTVNSTGVTGLTATLTAGNFANGAGTLTYTITGTPNTSGTASFAIQIGGISCTLEISVDGGAISTLDCAGATINGTLVEGVAASGVSADISYTGGNGGPHNGQTVTSTGVTGLTATLTAGNFASGAGTLTYTITGTPSTAGTASFAIEIGGMTCTLEIIIVGGSISTLDCAGATITGSLVEGVAASGVSADISYTGGNGGPHNGQTVTSTGVTGLTATLTAGNFANGSGVLTYTIIGTPNTSGTASFAINIGGVSCTLQITVVSGAVSTLDCASATITGTLVEGVIVSGVDAGIAYTGGNGGAHIGQTINSAGVTGLTAELSNGNFANGTGILTYTISGTPIGSGTASFAINIGGVSCTLQITVDGGVISTLDCASATITGTLVEGVIVSGVDAGIAYTGGNGGAHNGQTVTSTGVTGLTATLTAGNFANGAGVLTYTITGTPNTSGTASFAINIGGVSCTLQITVDGGAISTLDCASATITGTLVEGVAASGISTDISYTGGNSGPHNGQTVTSTGVTGLTATLTAGNFANGSGVLTYTIIGTPNTSGTASFAINISGVSCTLQITVVSGAISTLDCASATITGTLVEGFIANGVNAEISYTSGNGGPHNGQIVVSTGVTGLSAELAAGNFANGTGALMYEITGIPNSNGIAYFEIMIGGEVCMLEVSVLTVGMFLPNTVHCDVPTVVVDVMNPSTGKTWMDRNLGATQAYSFSSGVAAYGDLYQWGRGADGHQCRTSQSLSILSSSDKPLHGDFITTDSPPDDWRIGQNNNLWQGIYGVNNPCPVNYRLPTISELDLERLSWYQLSSDGAVGSPSIKLPTSGFRESNNAILWTGSGGYYWSSTISGSNAFCLGFTSSAAFVGNYNRSRGLSVRCIKDYVTLNCNSSFLWGTLTDGVAASGVSVEFSYTGGNGQAYISQTVNSTGVIGLTAELAAGNYANGSGTLTYNITGTPSAAGIANFAINVDGQNCNFSITVNVSQPLTVHCTGSPTTVIEVVNPTTGKTWMDRNLGATQAATSSTDVAAYGNLYQWGRGNDGHQCTNSSLTSIRSSTDQPGHGDFINTPLNPTDWRSPENTNLWVNGVNNPCPSEYRLPTNAEIAAEPGSWSNSNATGAFASPLKLSLAGGRVGVNGSYQGVGTYGRYWSSTVGGVGYSQGLFIDNSSAVMINIYRSNGQSVRCIKH